MARKAKSKKVKEQKRAGLTPKDYIFPGENASYWTGVIAVAMVFVWLAVAGYFTIQNAAGQKMWYIPLEIMAYPVLAFMIGNVLAARPRQAQLKKAGRQAKVMTNNFAELHRVLSRQAGWLGLKQIPDMYIVADPQPLIYCLPGKNGIVIASQALREAVTEQEFEALLAHELTHIKCKHVRVELAMVFIRNANVGVKILLFPIFLMMTFARAWQDLIDFTADRGALLVTLKPAVLSAALVKFAAAADPNAGVSREELQAFLDNQGDIQTDAEQLERHFKVGQFLGTMPDLKERIEQLSEFQNSEEGRAAIAKMAELQGVSLKDITVHRRAQDSGDIEHVQGDIEV